MRWFSLEIHLEDLDRIAIERACERLCLDYAHYADNGMAAEFGALFTEDAELILAGVSQTGAQINRNVIKRPGVTVRHVLSNVRIDVLGPDEARGTVYLALYAGNMDADREVVLTSAITPLSTGVYHDVYRRTPHGWRFVSRRMERGFERRPREAAPT
jgi:hypothetical protein